MDQPEKGSDGAKVMVLEARRYGFSPSIIKVKRGERVRLVLKSMDVTHGLQLDAFGISMASMPGKEEQVEFVANATGSFVFSCKNNCGRFHPFMKGKLIVEPNWWFRASLLAGLVPLLGMLFLCVKATPKKILGNDPASSSPLAWIMRGLGLSRRTGPKDLTKSRFFNRLIKRRIVPYAGLLPVAVLMVCVILSGLLGSPVGDHNLAVVLIWALWWPFLIVFMIPLGGRLWCAICPIAAPGEWLGRIVNSLRGGKPSKTATLPAFLQGEWPQNLSILAMASLGPVVSTLPVATACTLLIFVGLSIVLTLRFGGRPFCAGLCPVGGLMEVYSRSSPLLISVRTKDVCHAHEPKDCLLGNEKGHGCPWGQYPATMDGISRCGLCLECLHSCTMRNTALFLGLGGRENIGKGIQQATAWRISMLIAVGFVYNGTIMGSLGKTGIPSLLGFSFWPYWGVPMEVLTLGLFLIPSSVYLAACAARKLIGRDMNSARLWAEMSHTMIPLGLMAWVSFGLMALATGVSHLPTVLSDPLGRGWNLIGWAPEGSPARISGLLPPIQAVALFLGLSWSMFRLFAMTRNPMAEGEIRVGKASIPMGVLLVAMYGGMVWMIW